MSGGAGGDRFIFGADAAGNDVISDFAVSGTERGPARIRSRCLCQPGRSNGRAAHDSLGAGFFFDHGSIILAGLSVAQAKLAAMDFVA